MLPRKSSVQFACCLTPDVSFLVACYECGKPDHISHGTLLNVTKMFCFQKQIVMVVVRTLYDDAEWTAQQATTSVITAKAPVHSKKGTLCIFRLGACVPGVFLLKKTKRLTPNRCRPMAAAWKGTDMKSVESVNRKCILIFHEDK